jgi:hypothetical protein
VVTISAVYLNDLAVPLGESAEWVRALWPVEVRGGVPLGAVPVASGEGDA